MTSMADLPTDIQRLLDQARSAEDPSVADRARIGSALAAKLGLPDHGFLESPSLQAPLSAAKTSGSGWASLWSLKGLLSAAVIGAAATTWLAWPSAEPRTADRNPSSAHVVPAAPDATKAHNNTTEPVAPLVVGAPPALLADGRPNGSAAASGNVTAAGAPRVAEPAAKSGVRTHAPAVDVDPEAAGPHAKSASPVVGRSARSVDQAAPRDARRAPPSAALASEARHVPRSVAAPEGSVLERELALIREASRALDGRAPARALELIAEHTRRYERGFLAEEREALRISALCELDRRSEADALRRAFETKNARSPLRSRISTHCD